MQRGELVRIGIAAALVLAAGLAHYLDAEPVLAFLLAAAAIAMLAQLVGSATDQLGSRVGSSAAGVVQSALGTCPSSSSPCSRCTTGWCASCSRHSWAR